VEVPLVAEDLPLDELLELVRVSDHVLVRLDLLVGFDDAEVDAGQIDLARALVFAVPDEREMRLQVLCRLPDAVLGTRLAVKKTQLQGCLRLRPVQLGLLMRKTEDVH
jgi:hypothetical protein